MAPRPQPAARPLDGAGARRGARADAGARGGAAHRRHLELQRNDQADPGAPELDVPRGFRARQPRRGRGEAATGNLRARAGPRRRRRLRGGVRRGPLFDRRARGAAGRSRGGAARPRPVLGVARLSDGADRARCGQAAARVYLSPELWPAHFGRSRTGDVVLSMVEGIQQLEVYFGQYLPQLAVAALTPVLIFAFVAFIDLPVALVTLAAALLTLLAPVLWHRRESAHSRARQKAYAAYGAEFLDTLQGLPTLKAFGQSAARRSLLEDKGRALFESTMWVLGSNVLTRGIADTGIAVGAMAALALGVYRVQTGAMGLPSLLVILMLGVEVFRPLRELRVVLHQGMLGTSAAQGILAILRATPEVHESDGVPPVAALTPSVTFADATFAYPGGRAAVHQRLSFAVAPGERIGFVGPSGSGKSTIARLLLRFYDPQAGRILIGGHDVRALRLDDLRAQIAIVQQDTYLFHGTVEDNLRNGKPTAP